MENSGENPPTLETTPAEAQVDISDQAEENPEVEIKTPQSVSASDSSNAPVKPMKLKPVDADHYFANNDDRIARAKSQLVEECILPDLDGDFEQLFILTEIDHWNHDRERVVFICSKSILSINYSFITEKWTELTRIGIKCISTLEYGEMIYPSKSLLWPRPYKCQKLTFERLTGEATTAEIWNPFSRNLPWIIFTSHPLVEKISGDTSKYDIEHFEGEVMRVLEQYKNDNPDAPHFPNVKEAGIEMNVRIGFTSTVANQSKLAYAKDRGGVHF